MEIGTLNRRQALRVGMSAVPAISSIWSRPLFADESAVSQLPLKTTGLEHLGMTVPDQLETAKFYGRIFDPQLFQERDPPPRYYVRMGTAYIAFGGIAATAPAGTAGKIDHFCALVQDYKAPEMRKELEAQGIKMGAAPLGMPTDADGFRLQLLGVPGGLARTVIPGTRITTDDAAVQATGIDHVMLLVSDLEQAVGFYRKFFGPEVSRTKKPDRIWFAAAHTRLGLEAAAGRPVTIDYVSFKVAGFDKHATAEKLKKLNVELVPSDEKNAIRFRDPNRLVMELK